MSDEEEDDSDEGPVRLDKWLSAARFYRTRSIAKQAIEAGHVRYDGERAKVGRVVRVGARISAKQGWDDREVIVRALSALRQGAPEAQQLYEETAESRQRREDARLVRQSAPRFDAARPDKKQRREGFRVKRGDA